MILKVQVDAPIHMAQDVKECLAMKLEWIGPVRILEIRDDGRQAGRG